MRETGTAIGDGTKADRPGQAPSFGMEPASTIATGFESSPGPVVTGGARPDIRLQKQSSVPAPERGRAGSAATARPEERDAFHRFWDAAVAAADRLVAQSRGSDVVAKVNAAFDLDHALDDLWKLRGMHDEEWKSILNFLQTALKRARREGLLETFGSDECEALSSVLKGYLSGRSLDLTDTDEAAALLKRAGLDPFIIVPVSDE